jgi:hypothetical protein
MVEYSRKRRFQIALAVAGIAIEGIAIWLLASKQLSPTFATPIILAGMFMAFVPMFAVARAKRR